MKNVDYIKTSFDIPFKVKGTRRQQVETIVENWLYTMDKEENIMLCCPENCEKCLFDSPSKRSKKGCYERFAEWLLKIRK